MASRNDLYSWFETLDKPTQDQFAEMFRSFFHLEEDTLTIDKIEGLQEALEEKATSSDPDGAVPIQILNGTPGHLVVGDITIHNSVRIEYTVIRGTSIEMGNLKLDNKANELVSRQYEFDDCGFEFTKSISGNELRLAWTDPLANGSNALFYITSIKRTKIPA
jgi:hypothetical protein